MIGTVSKVRTKGWVGDKPLRSAACYDDKWEYAIHTENTSGSGDCEHESVGRAKTTDRSPPRQLRPNARMTRRLTLATVAKEYTWLWDLRHGISIKAIATREGVSIRRVRFGLARAEIQERGCSSVVAVKLPRLVPLFPIGPYTPFSSCRHKRPIQSGSLLCCMICHESGLDRHPALQRDPRADPAPEPKAAPSSQTLPKETRRQRRQRQFGS
jgi:hypothetical protein